MKFQEFYNIQEKKKKHIKSWVKNLTQLNKQDYFNDTKKEKIQTSRF